MAGQAIIVVGASAGGVEALLLLAGAIPADLNAALFVVLHTGGHSGTLPRLLSRRGQLSAVYATDGAPIERGAIYIAPGDHHLLVTRDHIHIVRGPKENGFRPAIDPLFRSAAAAYGPRVIGVILSGTLDDGTAGLLAVKHHGGIAIVQDPHEAIAPAMPRSALTYVAVDHVLPAAAIGRTLGQVAAGLVEGGGDVSRDNASMPDNDVTDTGISFVARGSPVPFSCPECNGVLSEYYEGTLPRFECQIGHRYSPESVDAEQQAALDRTLWSTMTTLNERVLLLRHLESRASNRGDLSAARRFGVQAQSAEVQREQLAKAISTPTATADIMDNDPAILRQSEA